MNLLDVAIHRPNILNKNAEQKRSKIFEPIPTIGLIKPDRPQKSYIVNDPFYMAPVNFANDIKENLINIKNGILGKSNDHDLGRINDFSMKAGALGLAGYLATRAKTPMAKSMEFIGFGTFFAAMALWPKLFIQAPLKAMYGLDIHQRYVDNEGRKKMFFQDPQYIPWDLYSSDELSKLGDKLGVPRNIENRNEVIKKKAHKIALQGNTLWMLTAGFATPLLSALMCNGIEKMATPRSDKAKFPNSVLGAVGSSFEKMKIERAEKGLKHTASIVAKKLNNYEPRGLNAIMQLNKGRELDDAVISDIVSLITHDAEVQLGEAVDNQVKDILGVSTTRANKDYAERFYDYIQDYQAKANDIAPIIKNPGDMLEPMRELDLSKITKEQLVEFTQDNPKISKFNRRVISYVAQLEPDGVDYDVDAVGKACRAFEKANKSRFFLTPDAMQEIRKLDRTLYEYSIRRGLLEKYYNVYFNNAAETVAANRWNNIANAFVEALDLNVKEIENAKMGESSASRLAIKKLEEVVADDKKYETAVRKVYNAILDFDRTVLPNEKNGQAQGIQKILEKRYADFYETMAERFKSLGFDFVAHRFVGDHITEQGCLADYSVKKLQNRTRELRSGMYKMLHVLDFFRRTSDVSKGINESSFAQDYLRKSAAHGGVDLRPTYETLLSDVSRLKKIIVEGTIADFTTKFGYKNPQIGLYDRDMKLLFSTDFAPKTKEVLGITETAAGNVQLGNITFVESFERHIREALSNLGKNPYPHAEKLTVRNVGGDVGHLLIRDALAGPRIDRVVRETASQMYNSSKWFKMFGSATAVLVGVTLLSQVFFGRLNAQDVQGRKGKK